MPVKINTTYRSPFFLFSKDLQTIYPAIFRKVVGVNYCRERISTHDEDFLDLDWSLIDSSDQRLVIISHGLEGDTHRPYVLGMVSALNIAGFNVLAWNYRGCSGELNKAYRFYHSGETGDLAFVIDYAVQKGFSSISLIGFSVGGNITLKFLGETGRNRHYIKKAVVYSVPCHLESASYQLAKLRSKIYMRRFIKSLSRKVRQKALLMPDKFDCAPLRGMKTFAEFDNYYTAPMFGYRDAVDYWTSNSSIYFIHNIRIPTLIINAQNDPFLSSQCFPYKEAEQNERVILEVTREGGHCGFYARHPQGLYWSEQRAVEFLNE